MGGARAPLFHVHASIFGKPRAMGFYDQLSLMALLLGRPMVRLIRLALIGAAAIAGYDIA